MIKALLIFLFFNNCPILLAMKASQLSNFLPLQINGWSKSDSDKFYNNETLFDYIDGAAELYLSYGFDTVISRRFSCPGEPDIIVEIFDMLEPRNAFGVFTNMREKNDLIYGQGSQQIEGSLIFWENRYFVSIIADKKTEKSSETIQQLARYIDGNLPGKSELPDILDLLPPENLINEGYCYFHHYIWLNAFYFISNNNILNIDKTVNAVLAKYGPNDRRTYLLIAEYPDSDKAQSAYSQFINLYAPELKNKLFVKLEDNTWVTARCKRKYVYAVFNVKNKKDTEALLYELDNKIQTLNKK